MCAFGDKQYVLFNALEKASTITEPVKDSKGTETVMPGREDDGEKTNEEQPDKKVVELSPKKSYYLQRTQMLSDLKGELLKWGKKRFGIIFIIALIILFLGVYTLVHHLIDQEFKQALKTAEQAELTAKQAVEAREIAEREVEIYKNTIQDLEEELQESDNIIADIQRKLRIKSVYAASSPRRPVRSFAERLNLEKITDSEAQIPSYEIPALDQQKQKEQLAVVEEEQALDNSLFKVMVVSNKYDMNQVPEMLLQQLSEKEFQTNSAHWSDSSKIDGKIEIRYTLDAAKKARIVRTMILSIYKDMGQNPPRISMRYGFPHDDSIDPKKDRIIAVYF